MNGLRKARAVVLGFLLAAAATFGFLRGRAAADQPRMRAALEELRAAKAELEISARDKGGHRVRAIRLVADAIGQVELGIQYERMR